MKPNIKEERISLLLAYEFTKSPYTGLKLDYLRVFNKLFRVDNKGLALQVNSIKRQRVSGRVYKVHVE